MTDSPQYTAAQILEMGHRAEHEGNLEYATQFYSYIADNLAGVPEAVDARLALERLSHRRQRRPEPTPDPHHPSHVTPAGYHEAPHTGPPAQPSSEVAHRQAPSATPATDRATTPENLPQAAQPDEGGEEEIEFVPGYRLGRFIASALQLFGWLILLAGLVYVGLTVAGVVGNEVAVTIGGLLPGLAAITTGLALVFIGTLAQATFAAANNTREILEIERAKAGW